ncbi:MAG: trypsin-like serine protease [Acidimicrobiales bacterium]
MTTAWDRKIRIAVCTCVVATVLVIAPMARPSAAITGGSQAQLSAMPWTVQVQQRRALSWFTACTGTLIGPTHVLTAGHCLQQYPGVGPALPPSGQPLFQVRVVMSDGSVMTPASGSVPPDFDYTTGRGDMAVLTLPTPSRLPTVQLAHSDPALGSVITGAGFGCTAYDSNVCMVDLLLGVAGFTTGGYGSLRTDAEDVLMAGGVATDPDAAALCGTPTWQVCTRWRNGVTRDGDSGGPLLISGPHGLAEAGVVHDQADTPAANQNGAGDRTTTWTSLASEPAFLQPFVGT